MSDKVVPLRRPFLKDKSVSATAPGNVLADADDGDWTLVLPPAQLADWIKLETSLGRPLSIEEFEAHSVQRSRKRARSPELDASQMHAAPGLESASPNQLLRLTPSTDWRLWQVATERPSPRSSIPNQPSTQMADVQRREPYSQTRTTETGLWCYPSSHRQP
jgi:hypothetical protein